MQCTRGYTVLTRNSTKDGTLSIDRIGKRVVRWYKLCTESCSPIRTLHTEAAHQSELCTRELLTNQNSAHRSCSPIRTLHIEADHQSELRTEKLFNQDTQNTVAVHHRNSAHRSYPQSELCIQKPLTIQSFAHRGFLPNRTLPREAVQPGFSIVSTEVF